MVFVLCCFFLICLYLNITSLATSVFLLFVLSLIFHLPPPFNKMKCDHYLKIFIYYV